MTFQTGLRARRPIAQGTDYGASPWQGRWRSHERHIASDGRLPWESRLKYWTQASWAARSRVEAHFHDRIGGRAEGTAGLCFKFPGERRNRSPVRFAGGDNR